jgi:hypothetical protein
MPAARPSIGIYVKTIEEIPNTSDAIALPLPGMFPMFCGYCGGGYCGGGYCGGGCDDWFSDGGVL